MMQIGKILAVILFVVTVLILCMLGLSNASDNYVLLYDFNDGVDGAISLFVTWTSQGTSLDAKLDTENSINGVQGSSVRLVADGWGDEHSSFGNWQIRDLVEEGKLSVDKACVIPEGVRYVSMWIKPLRGETNITFLSTHALINEQFPTGQRIQHRSVIKMVETELQFGNVASGIEIERKENGWFEVKWEVIDPEKLFFWYMPDGKGTRVLWPLDEVAIQLGPPIGFFGAELLIDQIGYYTD